MRNITRKHVVVLVALGLVLIVAGVGVTYVSKARDARTQTQCSGHMLQLTLALHGYAATRPTPAGNTLPPGTHPNAALPPDQRLSWHIAILPFVEQVTVFARADFASAWDSPMNLGPLGIAVPVYRCATIDRDDPRPITTYAGVTGVGPDSPTLPLDHSRAGVFGYDRRTPLSAIRDGASNTIMVMEYGREYVPWAKGGEGTMAWFRAPPHVGPGRPLGTPHVAERPLFGRNVGVGLVGFADGSRRVFRDTVSPGVLEGLSTIAGGEAVEIPE